MKKIIYILLVVVLIGGGYYLYMYQGLGNNNVGQGADNLLTYSQDYLALVDSIRFIPTSKQN